MVTRAVVGNTSGEATITVGNIFPEAMRQSALAEDRHPEYNTRENNLPGSSMNEQGAQAARYFTLDLALRSLPRRAGASVNSVGPLALATSRTCSCCSRSAYEMRMYAGACGGVSI
jgi:hypothetical protein